MKAIGLILVLVPFAAIFVLCLKTGGWRAVAFTFGVAGTVVGLIALGCCLMGAK